MAFITNTHKERINYYVSGYIENNYLLCFGLKHRKIRKYKNAACVTCMPQIPELHCPSFFYSNLTKHGLWRAHRWGHTWWLFLPHPWGLPRHFFHSEYLSLSFPTTYTSGPTCTHFILILQSLLGDLKGTGLGLVRNGCQETSLGLVFFSLYSLNPAFLQTNTIMSSTTEKAPATGFASS